MIPSCCAVSKKVWEVLLGDPKDIFIVVVGIKAIVFVELPQFSIMFFAPISMLLVFFSVSVQRSVCLKRFR